jgi:hypothetical protein
MKNVCEHYETYEQYTMGILVLWTDNSTSLEFFVERIEGNKIDNSHFVLGGFAC